MVLGLMLCAAQGINAQALDPDILQFLATGDTIYTEYIPDKDYAPAPWEKEGLHAGMQMSQFTLFTHRADKTYNVPDNVEMYIRLKDCYGELVGEKFGDASSALAFIDANDADFLGVTMKNFIERGGEYVFERGIPWLGISKTNDITLVDEPSVRLKDLNQLKTGSNLDAQVLFNTGYPYDYTRLTGQEKAEWTLSYQAPDSKERVELDKGEMALTFDNSKQPKLATIDTLKIFREKPALGEYYFEVKTDWEKEALGDMSHRNSLFRSSIPFAPRPPSTRSSTRWAPTSSWSLTSRSITATPSSIPLPPIPFPPCASAIRSPPKARSCSRKRRLCPRPQPTPRPGPS